MLRFVDDSIQNKRILLRVDFNITLNPDFSIADDFRIKRALPTIKLLLSNKNSLIVLSHLGKPKDHDTRFSLAPVVADLQKYLPDYKVELVQTIEEAKQKATDPNTIIFLENIRFFEGENKNDPEFSKQLAGLADVYVNDAFGVCHREVASIVGVPKLLPSFGGLLLQKEVEMLNAVINTPKHPVLAVMGGAKVSTKIQLISRLMTIADHLLIGGGLANTFFAAKGYSLGSSFYEKDETSHANTLLQLAKEKNTELVMPLDVIIGDKNNPDGNDEVVRPDSIKPDDTRAILDIGPETEALWGRLIQDARTIIWNGPVGLMEHKIFRRGTDFLYYAITQNSNAVSVVGGGETLTAISKKEYLDKITHISTGGGAMLEFIERGTLSGIEALKQNA